MKTQSWFCYHVRDLKVLYKDAVTCVADVQIFFINCWTFSRSPHVELREAWSVERVLLIPSSEVKSDCCLSGHCCIGMCRVVLCKCLDGCDMLKEVSVWCYLCSCELHIEKHTRTSRSCVPAQTHALRKSVESHLSYCVFSSSLAGFVCFFFCECSDFTCSSVFDCWSVEMMNCVICPSEWCCVFSSCFLLFCFWWYLVVFRWRDEGYRCHACADLRVLCVLLWVTWTPLTSHHSGLILHTWSIHRASLILRWIICPEKQTALQHSR